MIKAKIKGEGFKPFEIEIEELSLDKREELNVFIWEMFNAKKGMFGPSVNVIRTATNMTDEQINELSNDQIFQASIEISNVVNKKKLTK